MSQQLDYSKIGQGQRVWIGNKYGSRHDGLKSVHKVTPTQIVIDWNGDSGYLMRFKRTTGSAMGDNWQGTIITGIATPDECAEFAAAEKAANDARLDKEEADLQREHLRTELAALFIGTVWVKDETWNDRQGFTLELHSLSEARIREIAGVLRA